MKKATSLRLSEDLIKKASARARANHRNLTNQIEYYIKIAMAVEENPELPFIFIKETIEAKEEIKSGLGQPYPWGIIRQD